MITIGLEGKVALVTGAGRGIGRAIALRLAEAGANIAINYHKSPESAEKTCREVKAIGVKAITVNADVSNYGQVRSMIKEVTDYFKTIDILVNNTGITSVKIIEELEDTEWHRVLETNLSAAYYCAREVTTMMKKKKAGRIVNISSTAAYTGRGGGVHYASTKGGMNGLTLALARELAPHGILVNGIAPAVIDSDFLDIRYPTREERDRLADNIPIGRIGTGEDIANIVVFLCSDLSDYISGETILADGGRTFTGS